MRRGSSGRAAVQPVVPRGDGARMRALTGVVPRHIWILFALGSLYVVFPLIEIPLTGVSLSAPIFYLIVLEIAFGRTGLGLWPTMRWRLVLIAFLGGLLASYLVSTLVVSSAPASWRDALLLMRYVYWVVVFVVATVVVAHLGSPAGLVRLLGWAVIGLACFWFWDRFDLFGVTRSWLSPNSYGFVFSTFSPFALILPLLTRSRILASVGIAALGAAIVLNGSRGSWVAIGVATAVLVVLLARYRAFSVQTALAPLAAALFLLAAILLAPAGLTSRASEKLAVSSELDTDKSWVIRQVMVQKGLQLFREQPIFGVGAGRFTKTMADLELPVLLRYGSQEHFNRKSAHNSYVALLAETGLAGTVPFAVLVLGLFWRGIGATRRLVKRRELWSAAILCSLIGMSTHMWVISALTGTHVWLVYGLVAGTIAWQHRLVHTLEEAGSHEPRVIRRSPA